MNRFLPVFSFQSPMKKIYFLFSIITFNLFGQKYQTDQILINGKEYPYRFHHLEQYFNHYPEKRIVPNKDSTVFNRGYIAFFEIYDNELFLRDLKIPIKSDSLVSVREKFSPIKDERIPLRWVNGVIQIGVGKDDFSKDSLRPMNDNNLIFEIQRGKIKRKINFGKEEMRVFKNFQWNKYRTTYEYLVLYNRLAAYGLNPTEIDAHIFENLLYYSKRIYLQK